MQYQIILVPENGHFFQKVGYVLEPKKPSGNSSNKLCTYFEIWMAWASPKDIILDDVFIASPKRQ